MDSRSVVPPMSTTSLPASSETLDPAPPSIRPPILASDILREEVAPLAPGGATMRHALLVLVAGYLALGAAAFARLLPSDHLTLGATGITAGAAIVAWLGPVPYAGRAALAAMAGLLPLVLGAQARGPLRWMTTGPVPAGVVLILLTVLPAALLFRAQYRAFRAARAFLALALLASTAGVVLLGREALAADSSLGTRLTDVVALMAVMASFAGFLGPETTGACTLWSAVLLGGLTLRQLAILAPADPTVGTLLLPVAIALAEGLAATIASLGLYQLLASALAKRARRVDVHRIVGPSAEEI